MKTDPDESYKKIQQAIDANTSKDVKPDSDFRRILDQQVALKINEQTALKQNKSGFIPRGKWHISFATVLAGFFLFGGVVLAAVPGFREALVETVSPTHGTLIVESIPSDSIVYITHISNNNLDKVSKTPVEINLPSGTYEVRIEKEGYKQVTNLVTIKNGETTTLEETLEQDESGTISSVTQFQFTPFSSLDIGITFSYPDTWHVAETAEVVTFTDENLFAQLLVDTKPQSPSIPIESTQNISVAGQVITVNMFTSEDETVVVTSTPISDSTRDYYFSFSLPKNFDTDLIVSILESVQLVTPVNQDNGIQSYQVSATVFYDANGNGVFDTNESIVDNTTLEVAALNVPLDPQELDGQLEYFYPSAEGTSIETQNGIAEFVISDERDEHVYKAFAIKRMNNEVYASTKFRSQGFGDIAFPVVVDVSQTSSVEIPVYSAVTDGELEESLYNAEATIDFYFDENGNSMLDEHEEIISGGLVKEVHLVRSNGFVQFSKLNTESVLNITNLPYGTYSIQYAVQPDSSEDYLVSNIIDYPASTLIQNKKISIELIPGEQSHYHISIPVKF